MHCGGVVSADIWVQLYMATTLKTANYNYSFSSNAAFGTGSTTTAFDYVAKINDGYPTGAIIQITNAQAAGTAIALSSFGTSGAIASGRISNDTSVGVTGIRILTDNGADTFAAGTIRLYGIAKS
jgi:hypothetical protein